MTLTLFAALATSALVSAIWQGLVLAAVVALVLRLLPGLPAATRSAVWLMLFAAAVGLHLAPATATALHDAAPVQASPWWSFAVLSAWAGLSLVRAIQIGLGVARIGQIARRAVPVTASFSVEAGRGYGLCVSADVDRPSVLGFFAPKILLPVGLIEKLSAEELQQVLLHETEHLRRSDDWINLLQKLMLVVFPLNPVLFWVERRLCLERELACDDRVLAQTGMRKAYAACLTHLAEHALLSRGFSLALSVLGRARRSELGTRVRRILAGPAAPMHPRAARLATLALALSLGGAATTLARTPRLISFLPFTPSVASADSVQVPAPAPFVPAGDIFAKASFKSPSHLKPSYRSANLRKNRLRAYQLQRPVTAHQQVPTQVRQLLVSFQATAEQLAEEIGSAGQSKSSPRYVRAIVRVPVAYAFATPDGWIVISM